MKKLKVVDKYVAIKALLSGEKADMSVADALSFIDERIAITEKKNASGGNADRKPTAKQLENENVKVDILNFLATQSAPITMGEIMKGIGIDSNQRVTALVTSMLTVRKGEPNPDGKIVRSEVKGKAHYALPSAED